MKREAGSWKGNVATVAGVIIVLSILGFITYSIVSPKGILSGLKNDLKSIEGEAGGGYTDLNGTPLSMEQFKGRPLIINSWATWMPFSKDELVLLTEVQKTRGESIQVIAMNRMEASSLVKAYLSVHGIAEDIAFLLDPSDHFYTAVDGYAMPETLFYKVDGTLMMHKRGTLTKEELDGYIELILEQ